LNGVLAVWQAEMIPGSTAPYLIQIMLA